MYMHCLLSPPTCIVFSLTLLSLLSVPAKITMISITLDRGALLVMWNYTNPLLSEGAVISGYRVYLNGQRVEELTSSSMNQYSFLSLQPFTNYTVEVSAFNTRGDGMKQEGSKSDPLSLMTPGG